MLRALRASLAEDWSEIERFRDVLKPRGDFPLEIGGPLNGPGVRWNDVAHGGFRLALLFLSVFQLREARLDIFKVDALGRES